MRLDDCIKGQKAKSSKSQKHFGTLAGSIVDGDLAQPVHLDLSICTT
jgi:hypothetical protein